MSGVIPANTTKTLESIVGGDLKSFEVIIQEGNKKGEGFLGEIIFITLRNKISDNVMDLVMKQAFTSQTVRDMHPIRNVYINEIYFYTEVWPRFNKFQESIPLTFQFQKLPRCLAATSEENSEIIVLENLKRQGFELHDKKKPLDGNHFELILKEYGKLHGLSFAYKTLFPEDYTHLVAGLSNLFADIGSRDYFAKGNEHIHRTCLENLIPGIDDAVIDKYKCYPEICNKLFLQSINCETKYAAIVHGDCWSNNMMFKYDKTKQVVDIRFLDFQMSTEGSPCCDLSYCIYSGASKEILQNLNYYIQLYHDSLSETLEQFGCDVGDLYPLHELKNDWKRYCKLGVTMALMIWKLKLTHDDEIKDLEEMTKLSNEELISSGYDEGTYKKVTRDLILHLYENDFL